MTTDDIVRARGITEVLHFTKNRGLTGILHQRKVKSRKRLISDEELEYIFEPNANFRKDVNWLDYVNLSISEINREFFAVSANNWHAGRDLWWCILSFSPDILAHEGVVFATTNNIYTGVKRRLEYLGLESLFAPSIKRWTGNDIVRPPECPTYLTTCEQAEVLYPAELMTSFLNRIYVMRPEDQDDVCAQITATGHRTVEVVVSEQKFMGRG